MRIMFVVHAVEMHRNIIISSYIHSLAKFLLRRNVRSRYECLAFKGQLEDVNQFFI